MSLWHHNTTPALVPIHFFQACILSQPLVQALQPEKFDYRYYCITMKVSRDYIGNLIQRRKTLSLYEKTLIGPKRAVFNFFRTSMGGFSPPKPPLLPPVRTPLPFIHITLFMHVWSVHRTRPKSNGFGDEKLNARKIIFNKMATATSV